MNRISGAGFGLVVAGNVLFLVVSGFSAQAQLSEAIDVGRKATRSAERAQVRINQLDDERVEMAGQYRALLQRRDSADLYVRQQRRVVDAQERELASVRDQLGRIDEIRLQMAPMMQDMLSALTAFREADLPFKVVDDDGVDLRALRYEQLEGLSGDPDISPAEQYRLLLEAFQTEMEYGASIDTYRDQIPSGDGGIRTVDIFRYGRVGMVYLTENRSEVGRWNRSTRRWEKLPSRYRDDVLAAIRIAQKVATPVVLTLPVEKFSVNMDALDVFSGR